MCSGELVLDVRLRTLTLALRQGLSCAIIIHLTRAPSWDSNNEGLLPRKATIFFF